MKAPKAITRKAGPLPVWAWAALALVVGFVYLRSSRAAAGTGGSTPVLPAAGSGAQQPASGQGTPADNMDGDLLTALLGNMQSSYDAVLAALQYGGAGYGGFGGASVPAGFGGGGSADTSAVTAPTVTDSGVTFASAATQQSSPDAIAAAGDVPVTGSLATSLGYSPDAGLVLDPTTGQVYGPSSSIDGGLRQRVGQPYASDALGRYLTNTIGYDPAITSDPVGQPTAMLVQPAPVDTSTAFVATTPTPTPTSGTRFVAA